MMGLGIAAALALITGPAAAQGICVVCSEPWAIYRCVPGGSATATAAGGERGDALACVTELARRGGHAACSVRREADQCDAPERRVEMQAPAAGTAATSQPAAPVGAPEAKPAVATPEQQAQQGPPTTVEEMAKRTAAASERELDKAGSTVKRQMNSAGETLQKTGEAVGNAVGGTVTCVITLFTKCGIP